MAFLRVERVGRSWDIDKDAISTYREWWRVTTDGSDVLPSEVSKAGQLSRYRHGEPYPRCQGALLKTIRADQPDGDPLTWNVTFTWDTRLEGS